MKKLLCYFVTIFLYCDIAYSEPSISLFEGHSPEALRILEAAPKYYKGSAPQATVGVIPYRIVKNRVIEVLLGLETKDNTWSDFGGKYDKISDHSFLDALKREYREETNGSEIIDASIFSPKALMFYIDKAGKREILYIFYRVSSEVAFVPNNEKAVARWFNLGALYDKNTAYPIRRYLKEDLIDSIVFPKITQWLRDR